MGNNFFIYHTEISTAVKYKIEERFCFEDTEHLDQMSAQLYLCFMTLGKLFYLSFTLHKIFFS